MAHPMGESKQGCLRVDFDHRLKLDFHGSKVTTDAGLLAYREPDASVELTETAGDVLADSRAGENGRHGMVGNGRHVTFQLAEVAVPRELFRKILSIIDDLRPRPTPA